MTNATQSCPNCRREVEGSFCEHCGASLEGEKCRSCGHTLPSGAVFCHECGADNRESRSVPPAAIWAGFALVAAVAFTTGYVAGNTSGTGAAPPPTASAPAPGAVQDLGPLSPSEQANELFNIVMTAYENGDPSTVAAHAPGALQAYAAIGRLNADGHYHVGLIHTAVGDYDAARARVDSMLQFASGHLLASMLLSVASELSGDNAGIQSAIQGFLDNYDEEMAVGRQEYGEHSRAIEQFHTTAMETVRDP